MEFLIALGNISAGFGLGVLFSCWLQDLKPHKADCTCIDCDLYRMKGNSHDN